MTQRLDSRPFIARFGSWISQGINLFLAGSPGESLSGRTYREAALGKPHWVFLRHTIDLIFWVYEARHCRLAYLGDLERAKKRLEKASVTKPL